MMLASLTTTTMTMMIGLLAVAGDPDPSVLVNQLGSARFAEREQAARLLIEQGSASLPALRKANEARDPEVRTRAAALLEQIEGELLIRPTMVRLDFENAPLADVVRTISERSRIAITLQPENHPLLRERKVTLTQSEPVRFWEAIDRLDQAAGIQSIPSDGGVVGRRSGLILALGAGWVPGPKVESGPFRVYLTNLRYSVDINLGGQSIRPRVPVGLVPPPPGPVVPEPMVPSRVASNEQFDATIQIQAEPRMSLAANGPLKLVEALDDKNQSLIPTADAAALVNRGGIRYTGGMAVQGYGNTSVIASTAQLRRPDQPGRLIRVLKGTVPVMVSTRKEGPTVVTLADAKTKPARMGDQNVSIIDARFEPANHRHVVEIVARPEAQAGGLTGPRLAILSSNQIEFIDAQDRAYPQWFTQSLRQTPDELRMTVNLMPQDGLGPPVKLRYYELSRASTEVQFDFRNLDVRMP